MSEHRKPVLASVAMAVLLLLLQVVPANAAKPKEQAAWTFMVYIVGDNDL